ncbi:MAG TPA: nitrous oxide-stimulated promoter family protein [Holophaga sp.]|nr:nitrous oxide-stimulated promoter family protein [Holophaga sp.]
MAPLRRIARERRTLACMVTLYCRGHHKGAGSTAPCADCRALLEEALARIAKCPFADGKPVCAKCRIHCHKPGARDRIRAVMRYAGPWMLLHHPVLTLLHYLDSLRRPG